MALTDRTRPVVELFAEHEDGPETRLILDQDGLEQILRDYIPHCGYGIYGRFCDPLEPDSVEQTARDQANSIFKAIAHYQQHHEHSD